MPKKHSGRHAQVIMAWEKPFWDDAQFLIRERSDWSGRFSVALNWNRTFGNYPILTWLHAADTMAALEKLPVQAVVAEAMQVGWCG